MFRLFNTIAFKRRVAENRVNRDGAFSIQALRETTGVLAENRRACAVVHAEKIMRENCSPKVEK